MKVYIVSIRMALRAGAHNAEIAESVANIVSAHGKRQPSQQLTADKGKNYIVLDIWPPYDAGNGEQWASECCAKINQLDKLVVQAEVLRAEMSKPS